MADTGSLLGGVGKRSGDSDAQPPDVRLNLVSCRWLAFHGRSGRFLLLVEGRAPAVQGGRTASDGQTGGQHSQGVRLLTRHLRRTRVIPPFESR